MATVFTSELLDAQQRQETVQNEATVHDVTARIRTLENAFAFTFRKALHLLKMVNEELQQASDEVEQLHKAIRTLRIVYLNGKVEAADGGQQTRFPLILNDYSGPTC